MKRIVQRALLGVLVTSAGFGSLLAQSSVQTGIDVLQASGFAELAGKRVGLVTNHTGIDAQARPTVEVLAAAPTKLRAIFSPEHGLFGKLDQSSIADSVWGEDRVPVYSLYGKTRRPSAEALATIDILVFDIQDIGCRFYTYISTLGNCMEAAAEAGVKVMVLDRPNPIGGERMHGPMLDPGIESFIAWHHLPVRHGMTVGELAKMFRGRARHEARPRGRSLQGLGSLPALRCHRASLGQSLSQHALADAGLALSRSRYSGDH